MMTTIKEEADRFNYLKNKVDGSEILSPEESKEWQEKNWIVAAYYVDKEALDAVEIAASNFIGRVIEGRNGNVNAWPTSEIDGSESTKQALRQVNPLPKPDSVVVFDGTDSYGTQEDGRAFLEARGDEICSLVSQRLEYDDTIKMLEAEKDECDNRIASIMKDKEKFVVPGCSVTYKIHQGREFANAKAVRAYFDIRGEKVPDGLISKSEDARSIRFTRSRKKK